MKTGTKMSNASERIKGYCTEVTQAQWEELVRVAHEKGIGKGFASKKGNLAFLHINGNLIWLADKAVFNQAIPRETIPFPDFLAKLRGEECDGDPFTAEQTRLMAAKSRGEEWVPKAGEMVEVEVGKLYPTWSKAEMVCVHKGYYICNEVNNWQYMPYKLNQIRPITPTITRAEAEAQLGKRIID